MELIYSVYIWQPPTSAKAVFVYGPHATAKAVKNHMRTGFKTKKKDTGKSSKIDGHPSEKYQIDLISFKII